MTRSHRDDVLANENFFYLFIFAFRLSQSSNVLCYKSNVTQMKIRLFEKSLGDVNLIRRRKFLLHVLLILKAVFQFPAFEVRSQIYGRHSNFNVGRQP